jgi:uracil-DNA glycosylase
MNKLINIEDNWYQRLQHVIESDKFKEFGKYLAAERANKDIYPKREEVFRILNDVPFKDVKIVLIGQDPYHNLYKGEPVACGYSFAPRDKEFIPPSLRQIYKALNNDLYEDTLTFESDLNLSKWVSQGVMLLNMGLTVEKGKPGSHLKHWEFFTKEIIKSFDSSSGIIFMLWGKYAQEMKSLINQDLHYVLECSHPASAIYSGTEWVCSNFRKANEILYGNHNDQISWLDINHRSSQNELTKLIS